MVLQRRRFSPDVLVDSGPLYALNSPRDQYFTKAQRILKKLQNEKSRLVTTDYVIDEAVTTLLTTKRGGYHFAMNLLNWIFSPRKTSPQLRIEWITPSRFHRARVIFRRFNRDKTWSFTDCTSYALMNELKLKKAFTFDEHFTQMGFEVFE